MGTDSPKPSPRVAAPRVRTRHTMPSWPVRGPVIIPHHGPTGIRARHAARLRLGKPLTKTRRRAPALLAVLTLATLPVWPMLALSDDSAAKPSAGSAGSSEPDTGVDGGGPAPFMATPDSESPSAAGTGAGTGAQPGSARQQINPGGSSIPVTVLAAYHLAESAMASSLPSCHLTWQMTAGIGKVESNHASGGRLTSDGTAAPAILGPVLNGSSGTAAIGDTDEGTLDGDTTWDRAVGPMQFIPSSWERWGQTERPGAVPDPQNIYDAALAAARYLCAAGGDLSTPEGLNKAILAYNHSDAYLTVVLSWIRQYTSGGAVTTTADAPAGTAQPPTAEPAATAPVATAESAVPSESPTSPAAAESSASPSTSDTPTDTPTTTPTTETPTAAAESSAATAEQEAPAPSQEATPEPATGTPETTDSTTAGSEDTGTPGTESPSGTAESPTP